MIESTAVAACKVCGRPSPNALQCEPCRTGTAAPQQVATKTGPAFPGCVVLELPWSALASDNLRTGKDKPEVFKERQGRYAAAKARAQDKLRGQYHGQPFAGPARVLITVFVPDRKKRDGPNFLKLIGDSLKGIVLTADDFDVMADTRIRRGGIDPDRPRAEITVEAIANA